MSTLQGEPGDARASPKEVADREHPGDAPSIGKGGGRIMNLLNPQNGSCKSTAKPWTLGGTSFGGSISSSAGGNESGTKIIEGKDIEDHDARNQRSQKKPVTLPKFEEEDKHLIEAGDEGT